MKDTELHWLPLLEISKRLANKSLSPVALTSIMLARIEQRDGALGSFAEVTYDRAFVAARQAEVEIERGQYRGPLHGVPVAVKGLCDVAGEPSGAGTKILAERLARKNATVVRKLEAAGAVVLGLLTMTEGASAVHHPSITPPTNPWDPAAWTGASSSGSGVATAAGLCFGSLGSDTAGSIRTPSHFCGVVGMKPTYGRVSRAGVFSLSTTLDHIGPMTRTVADGAAMLEVIAGPDPRDPTASQRAVPSYLDSIDEPLTGYRIGYDEGYASDGVDPELAAAVRAAKGVLESAGATVVSIEVPDRAHALEAGATILHADAAQAHLPYFDDSKDDYGPHLREIVEIGRQITGQALARAHELRREWVGQLEALFGTIDAIVCPPTVAAAPPARLTAALPGDFRSQGRFFRFTLPFTVSGHPALTVPCGFNHAGLPLGFQLIGRPFDEGRLFQAGHAYQRTTDWHEHHPSL